MDTKHGSARTALALCVLVFPVLGYAQAADPFPPFISLAGSPEGLAVDKVGNLYVSLQVPSENSDQIWKFSRCGEQSLLADFGPPAGGRCGLALDVEGNLYMARNWPPPPIPQPPSPYTGVYRVDQAGNITLVPGTDQMNFPDALAFDQRGNMYITETFSPGPDGPSFGLGGIWRVPKSGTAELWIEHDLLTGVAPTLFPFRVGANGIAFYHGDLYVVNTDKTLIVRIAVRPDGSPGKPEVWAQVEEVNESFLAGSPFPLMIEGIALDVLGNAYVTVPSRNAVLRINADDRSQETIAVMNPVPDVPQFFLDAAANPVFGTGNGERQNMILTNMGMYGFMVPIEGWTWPGPSLVKLQVDVPGVPVP